MLQKAPFFSGVAERQVNISISRHWGVSPLPDWGPNSKAEVNLKQLSQKHSDAQFLSQLLAKEMNGAADHSGRRYHCRTSDDAR